MGVRVCSGDIGRRGGVRHRERGKASAARLKVCVRVKEAVLWREEGVRAQAFPPRLDEFEHLVPCTEGYLVAGCDASEDGLVCGVVEMMYDFDAGPHEGVEEEDREMYHVSIGVEQAQVQGS